MPSCCLAVFELQAGTTQWFQTAKHAPLESKRHQDLLCLLMSMKLEVHQTTQRARRSRSRAPSLALSSSKASTVASPHLRMPLRRRSVFQFGKTLALTRILPMRVSDTDGGTRSLGCTPS